MRFVIQPIKTEVRFVPQQEIFCLTGESSVRAATHVRIRDTWGPTDAQYREGSDLALERGASSVTASLQKVSDSSRLETKLNRVQAAGRPVSDCQRAG